MKTLKYLLIFQVFILFFSCKAPGDVVYFQNTKHLEQITIKKIPQAIFEVDDLISIYVSAIDMQTALPFNLSQGASGNNSEGGGQGRNSSSPIYLIDYEGNIDFPVLGKLKISGLSRIEVVKLITEKLEVYINAPVVTVKLENFNITILGEVSNPGTYNITNEKVNLTQAIGLAGDLTIKGKRKNITVIREADTLKTYYKMDLTSKEIFNSPAFYLKQNDIVYVEPNESKVRTSKTNSNAFGIALSLIGVILSLVNFAQ